MQKPHTFAVLCGELPSRVKATSLCASQWAAHKRRQISQGIRARGPMDKSFDHAPRSLS